MIMCCFVIIKNRTHFFLQRNWTFIQKELIHFTAFWRGKTLKNRTHFFPNFQFSEMIFNGYSCKWLQLLLPAAIKLLYTMIRLSVFAFLRGNFVAWKSNNRNVKAVILTKLVIWLFNFKNYLYKFWIRQLFIMHDTNKK